MQLLPPAAQQCAVCCILRQRVLEGVSGHFTGSVLICSRFLETRSKQGRSLAPSETRRKSRPDIASRTRFLAEGPFAHQRGRDGGRRADAVEKPSKDHYDNGPPASFEVLVSCLSNTIGSTRGTVGGRS